MSDRLGTSLRFVKMHGLGNDFVMVDALVEPLSDGPIEALATAICDRHFGVGADGLVFALPSEVADFRMRIFNSDGSEAAHCGNAIRCFARFLHEQGHTTAASLSVETVGRVNHLELEFEAGRVERVRVDMGEPEFRRGQIPMVGDAEQEAVEVPWQVAEVMLNVTAVSMGNPHAVVFVEDLATFPFDRLGPLCEKHPDFPRRVNTEFIQVLSPTSLQMRVWERGAGETLACGTGACAALAAAVRTGRTGRSATVHLPGGDLQITWGDDNHLYMTGPVAEVFRGEWLGGT